MLLLLFIQDFILEHYSEDGGHYEEAIADLMDTRQVGIEIYPVIVRKIVVLERVHPDSHNLRHTL